jgi:hypothetical protein
VVWREDHSPMRVVLLSQVVPIFRRVVGGVYSSARLCRIVGSRPVCEVRPEEEQIAWSHTLKLASQRPSKLQLTRLQQNLGPLLSVLPFLVDDLVFRVERDVHAM